VLAADAEVGFDLVGPGGDAAFADLCRRQSRVTYHGPRQPEIVADLLRNARALLLSSRWESGPLVANEALSLGCTLVGPARVPSFEAICASGRYGTACRGGSSRSLAAAVLDELRAWDDGRRDPAAIAATWRPRFDPRTVCGQLLKPCDMPCD
jgi:glycosyltransferase involved in cell wall biosynthesis